MRAKTKPKLSDLVSAIAKFTTDMDSVASIVRSDDDYSGVICISYSDDGSKDEYYVKINERRVCDTFILSVEHNTPQAASVLTGNETLVSATPLGLWTVMWGMEVYTDEEADAS